MTVNIFLTATFSAISDILNTPFLSVIENTANFDGIFPIILIF